MAAGEEHENKTWMPRNYGNLKRFRAMIKYASERSVKWKNQEHLIYELKLRIGHYDFHTTSKGVIVPRVKSFSFSKMDEAEFREVFSKCIDALLGYIVQDAKPGDRENLENIILSFT